MKKIILYILIMLGIIFCYVYFSGRNDNGNMSNDIDNNNNNNNNMFGDVDMIDNKLYIKVNDKILEAVFEDNSSVDEFKKKLLIGDIIVSMEDYNNLEKVGDLGFSISRNDEWITTSYGDIILYLGNKIAIYYDENSYSFTKLGRIINVNQEELEDILGKGNIVVTFSLNKE